MLREDFTLEEFGKIFQAFNDAVYRGDAKKLAYKSWKNINSWSKGKYEKMRVSKEWVRCREGDDYHYQYHDEERIFVGPYDINRACPNPEELDLNDGSLGSWLDGVLVRESLMALNSCCSDIDKVAYTGATAYATLLDTSINATSLKTTMEDLQSSTYTVDGASGKYVDWDKIAIGSDKYCSPTIEVSNDAFRIDGKTLREFIDELNEEKENKTMNFNFDFGPVDSSVRMSMYGMAVKNANGNYVAYDTANKRIMDVDILNFEGANKFMYKMPVAVKDVAVGDIVVHMRKPMIVLNANEDSTFTVVDVYNGEEKIIIPTVSPFGFSFMTKIINFMGNFSNGSATENNPFGNMLPFILMNTNDKNAISPIVLMTLMSNNQNFSSNPFLMLAMMDNKNDSNLLPFMMLMNNSTVQKCNCCCDKGRNE